MLRLITFVVLIFIGIWLLGQRSMNLQKTMGSNNLTIENTKHSQYVLPDKIIEAGIFARSNKLDSGLAMLIDYGKHSGYKRAYLVDLLSERPIDSFMVSHGCGNQPWGLDYSRNNPRFSNRPESHCSSLGHYKIGKRGYSSWGINVKYLLHGMDSSNSNALSRNIVMHGWADIPDGETYPAGTPEGWGCPAFSNSSMRLIDSTLKTRKMPVLLFAY